MALNFLNNGYFAGKVGIGAISPTVGLQLGNSTLGQTQLAIFNSEGGGEVGLTIKSRTNRAKLRVADNDSNAYIVAEAGKSFFGTSANGDATNITVLTSGNVGIGNISPTTSLDILSSNFAPIRMIRNVDNSNVAINYTDTAGVNWYAGKSGLNHFSIGIAPNLSTNTLFNLTSSGNVGIGTTSPSAILDVSAANPRVKVTATTGTNPSYLNINNTGGSTYVGMESSVAGSEFTGTTAYASVFGSSGARDTQFLTGTAVKMTIKSGGNVGIGTTNPAFPLEVENASTAYIFSETTGAATSSGYRWKTTSSEFAWFSTSGTNAMALYDYVANAERMRIDSLGNVLVNKTSSTGDVFQVQGRDQVFASRLDGSTTTGQSYGLRVRAGTNSVDTSMLVENTSGTDLFEIKGTGNATFAGLVSGITPVAAANFVTKAYVDGSGGGTGPFLPLAGGTMTGTNGITMPDNFPLLLGTSGINDSQIFWDGSNIEIQARKANADIVFRSANNSGNLLEFLAIDGGVEKTRAYKDIHFQDNIKATFGDTTSPDLQIYHDGSDSYINEIGTGSLYLKSAISLVLSNITSGSVWIECINNQVELKNAGSTKLTTTSTGVTVTGNLTTSDDITINNSSPEIYLTNTNAAKYNWMVAAQENVDQTFEITPSTTTGGSIYNAPALQISGSTSNATFAGTVRAEGRFDLQDGTSVFQLRNTSGAFDIRNGNTGVIPLAIDSSSNATFTNKVTSTSATIGTDNNATLTTKGYVDGLVTGVPVYRGTWDASGTAGGTPDLRLAANKVLGNYYIVSTAGSATPNGAGTEPDSWNVGDWCIFSDITPGAGTDLWQKIDNTSVISGAGTGQKVTKWDGTSGAASETLTDGPITFSTSNDDSTFAGKIVVGESATPEVRLKKTETGTAKVSFYSANVQKSYLDLDLSEDMNYYAASGVRNVFFAGGVLNEIKTGANSTFAGDVTLTNGQLTVTHDTNNVAKIIQSATSMSNATYTFEVDSSSHDSNMSAAGAMAVDVNSGRAFTITGAGKVGIGTTSPGAKLEVAETTANTDVVVNIKATRDSYLQFSPANTTKWALIADYPAVGDFTTYNYPSNFNSIICKSNKDITTNLGGGDFGIGTTNPGEKLEVAGNLRIHNPTNAPYIDFVENGATTDSKARITMDQVDTDNGTLIFSTEGSGTLSERMRINSQGQMWLGGSFTGADIANGNTTYLNNLNAGAFSILHRNASDAYIHFNAYYNSSNQYIAKYAGTGFLMGVNGSNNNGYQIYKAPSVAAGAIQSFTQIMTIGYGTNNNVGIGTTSPGATLELNSATPNAAKLKIGRGIGLTNYLELGTSGGSSAINAIGISGANASLIFNRSTTTTTTQSMIIDGSGNVGIGITVPQSKLHVNGGISVGPDTTRSEILGPTSGNANMTFAANAGNVNTSEAEFIFTNSLTGSSTRVERMRISSAGAIKFNAYGAGTLVTDASGNITVSSGGGAGGPYLPVANPTFTGTITGPNANITSTVTTSRLVVNGTGNAIELNQSATGAATYYVMDNTVETGGKRWRFGYSGCSFDKSSFSFCNTTDNIMPLLLSGANATFAGNVTLSSGSPVLKVEAKNANSFVDPALEFTTWNVASGASSGAIKLTNGTFNSNDMAFFTETSNSVTEKMRIRSSGNVGIGMTNPQSKLQVAGGIQMADDTATPSATKAGTMRYRTGTEDVETGGELISNGNNISAASWIISASAWTFVNGQAVFGDTVNDAFYQSGLTLPSGNKFKLKFTVSNLTSGSANIYIGNSFGNADYIGTGYTNYANGTYEIVITMPSIQVSLAFWGGLSSGSTFNISNVSLIELVTEDASYADMCMRTGSSTYEWVNIVRNIY